MRTTAAFTALSLMILLTTHAQSRKLSQNSNLQRIKFNNPGLTVDLGVGLWAQPFPVDFDQDGDIDLLCATADVPYNGIYLFENAGPPDQTWPTFKPAVRLDKAMHNITISYLNNTWLIQTPGQKYPDFKNTFFAKPEPIPYEPTFKATRTRQWKLVDYDGDKINDLIFGASDWTEYGWDDAYDKNGVWQQGPLHGHIYIMKNTGTNNSPIYSEALQLKAGNKPLDVYGCPSPNFVDMDKDGDLDLITGEFLDRITYFENTGTRTQPVYAVGKFLTHQGKTIHQDLQMLQVVVFDWNKDNQPDIIVGKEDGRVALMLNTGKFEDGVPQFALPKFLQQQADKLKIGALCTPFSVDWDNDGDEDIIAGDTAGYINFVENLDDGNPPRWAKPLHLKAEGKIIRQQAGPNGSIQGPAEAKWGYTTLNVADWDHDGDLDIVTNDIWGQIQWYENNGIQTNAHLTKAKPILVAYEDDTPKPTWNWWNPEPGHLVTQWRTTPIIHDLNQDGLNDLVMLDQEGYLAYFERTKKDGRLSLLPPQRIFQDETGNSLRLNEREAGKSGRRKLDLVDWNLDGKLDLLLNGKNIDYMENIATQKGQYIFKRARPLDRHKLAGHTTSPAIIDWDKNGIPDLLVGAEDGHLYHLKNPNQK
ncbi:MAG: VCBS repeat-containing protein [Candidatus Hydrogenedentota bacterium]